MTLRETHRKGDRALDNAVKTRCSKPTSQSKLNLVNCVNLFVLYDVIMLGFSPFHPTYKLQTIYQLLVKNYYPSSPVFFSVEQETSESDEQRKSSEKQQLTLPKLVK